MERVWADVEVMTAPKAPNGFQLFRKTFAKSLAEQGSNLSGLDTNKFLTDEWKENEGLREKYNNYANAVGSLLKELRELEPRVNTLVMARIRVENHSKQQFMREIDPNDVENYWKLRSRRFKRSLKHFGETREEQRNTFFRRLSLFRKEKNQQFVSMLCELSEEEFDLFTLFSAVVHLGGFVSVTRQGLWEHVSSQYFQLICGDKISAYLLKMVYFVQLYRFEQMSQNPETSRTNIPTHKCVPTPSDKILERRRKRKHFTASESIYTGNYYSVQGMETLFTSLICEVEEQVIWALNELLLLSHNRDLDVPLYPQILDALVLLLKEYLLPPTNSLVSPPRYSTDLSSAILVIVSNLSLLHPYRQPIGSCKPLITCLVKLLGSYSAQLSKLSAGILSRVACYTDLSSSPTWLSDLYIWVEHSILSSLSSQSSSDSSQYDALVILTLLSVRMENAPILSATLPLHIILHLSHLLVKPNPQPRILVAALEALFHLMRASEKLRKKIAQQTKTIFILASLLDFSGCDKEDVDNRVRRTSAAALYLLFKVPENQCFYEEVEAMIFSSAAQYFEVAYFLTPILKGLSR